MVKKENKTKHICKKCKIEMTYFFIDTAEEFKEGFSCDKCGKEKVTSKIKIMKATKSTKSYRQRVVDTSMPVIDWTIPKLENRFYYVHDLKNGRKYYNPILNILRTEVKIVSPVKQAELITQITQHKLARQIRQDIKDSEVAE